VSQNPYGIDQEYDFVEQWIESHRNSETQTVEEQQAASAESGETETRTVAPAAEADEKSNSEDDADAALRREAERKYHEYLVDAVAMSPRVSIVQQWLELDTNKIMQGQIWRILTSAFCHDRHGLLHILFNMLGLIWFGIALEYMYGEREFLLFYLSAAMLSGLAYVGLDLWTGESVPAIGASGAVMGVLMLYACHFPYHTIRIWFFFPLEMRWLVLLYVAFDLHPLLLMLAGDQVFTGVAHAAHLGGLAFGFVYWNQRLRLAPLVDSIKKFDWRKVFRRPPNLTLHTDEPDPRKLPEKTVSSAALSEQDRMDELLIKISREGRENLSAEELEVLNQASERLRRKKN
jgi:membrane associated rhomboid family serine protease